MKCQSCEKNQCDNQFIQTFWNNCRCKVLKNGNNTGKDESYNYGQCDWLVCLHIYNYTTNVEICVVTGTPNADAILLA